MDFLNQSMKPAEIPVLMQTHDYDTNQNEYRCSILYIVLQ